MTYQLCLNNSRLGGLSSRTNHVLDLFELTHRCNLACIYCDRHTPMPGEMTREQIFTALELLVTTEGGTRKVNLNRGDPPTHRPVW